MGTPQALTEPDSPRRPSNRPIMNGQGSKFRRKNEAAIAALMSERNHAEGEKWAPNSSSRASLRPICAVQRYRSKLRAYLEEEMRAWEKAFPDEL